MVIKEAGVVAFCYLIIIFDAMVKATGWKTK